MIHNQPEYESLNASALRYHFSAWEVLIDLISAFDRANEHNEDQSEATWNIEFREYLKKCRFEAEAIFTNIAQSSELCLRAMICRVSPYLLLIDTENRFRQNTPDIDFTELRTVDAVDLPRIVNAVCDRRLPDNFVNQYSHIRSLRNKIVHLAVLQQEIEHNEIIGVLVDQYSALWEGKHFFKNWLDYSARRSTSHFFDSKNYTQHTDVMANVPFLSHHLTKSQFHVVFGYSKQKRRYICADCIYEACIDRFEGDFTNYKTAILKDDSHIYCAVCEEVRAVNRLKCSDSTCRGDVIRNDDGYPSFCCSCGQYVDESL